MRIASLKLALGFAATATFIGCIGSGSGGVEPDPGPGEDELCDGCCYVAADHCGPSEVCRYAEADLDDEDAVGACAPADGLLYDLIVAEVSLCERLPDGDTWDAGAGAPDLRISLVVNGSVVATSQEATDTYTPFADGILFQQTLRSTDEVQLDFVDVDAFDDDFVGSICIGQCDGPIGIDTLRGVFADNADYGPCSDFPIEFLDLFLYPTPN